MRVRTPDYKDEYTDKGVRVRNPEYSGESCETYRSPECADEACMRANPASYVCTEYSVDASLIARAPADELAHCRAAAVTVKLTER